MKPTTPTSTEKTVKITQTVGDEDERDNGHDEDAEENSLDGMREDFSELVEEGEEGMVDVGGEGRGVHDLPDSLHGQHRFLGADDPFGLQEEPEGGHPVPRQQHVPADGVGGGLGEEAPQPGLELAARGDVEHQEVVLRHLQEHVEPGLAEGRVARDHRQLLQLADQAEHLVMTAVTINPNHHHDCD
jgi:hypothetical protein